MLVVVSDLHLGDGTAGPPNVSAEAMALWLDHVLDLAEHNRARRIDLLYLGDIFDLLRTERWFVDGPSEVPLADRPWASPAARAVPEALSGGCMARALQIARAVAAACTPQLALLRCDPVAARAAARAEETQLRGMCDALEQRLSRPHAEIHRWYVPGNHDRLFLLPDVAGVILGALGATPTAAEGGHAYVDVDYGVLARHGHEWDVWNFERHDRARLPSPSDYGCAPIGDVITTELMVRIPWAVRRELASRPGASAPNAREVYDRLSQLEDVRPLSAAVPWLAWQAGDLLRPSPGAPEVPRDVVDTVEQVGRQVFQAFLELPFVKAWTREHDRWSPLDESDKLKDVYRLARACHLETLGRWISRYEKIAGWFADGEERGAARDLDGPAGQQASRCVYGHTHHPRMHPVRRDPRRGELVYLNTGTWRPRIYQALDRESFLDVKELSYVVFCAPAHDRGVSGRAFETWTGSQLKGAR